MREYSRSRRTPNPLSAGSGQNWTAFLFGGDALRCRLLASAADAARSGLPQSSSIRSRQIVLPLHLADVSPVAIGVAVSMIGPTANNVVDSNIVLPWDAPWSEQF
jgi:hypothetical protein